MLSVLCFVSHPCVLLALVITFHIGPGQQGDSIRTAIGVQQFRVVRIIQWLLHSWNSYESQYQFLYSLHSWNSTNHSFNSVFIAFPGILYHSSILYSLNFLEFVSQFNSVFIDSVFITLSESDQRPRPTQNNDNDIHQRNNDGHQ